MNQVKRIGDITQKSTDLLFCPAVYDAAGTKINDQRENNDDTYGFIQAIHPEMFRPADSRHVQNCCNEKRAP